MARIFIIGNGISGVTAARHIRKLSNHDITIISAESTHFFSRTALMYVYMGHMRFKDIKPYEDEFWKKNRIELLHDGVIGIEFISKSLTLESGLKMHYDQLILATGSIPNKMGWPGQDLQGVSGLYHLQDLEMMEQYSKNCSRAVIVGGGLIGIEMAEMFHSRHIPVTLVVREKEYWYNILPPEEAAMITKHIHEQNIDLKLNCELTEILDNGQGEAAGVVLSNGEQIECNYVGLTVGVKPNIEFLKNTALETDRGILVNEHLETNIADVYAIGDCAQLRHALSGRKPIEAIWYTGRMMGETVAYNICKEPVSYNPGIWFNSAKFLDIEYQVYGFVPSKIQSPFNSFYWEHPDGKKSIRLVFNIETSEILGFNLMGIRFRHEVCETWISKKTGLNDVVQNIRLAFFDPEFYKNYEVSFVESFNQQFNQQIILNKNKTMNHVFKFLTQK
ncbi:MAG: NAD(P)/FAD-dependent oxidoreductase [Saprospiraceae bacterium]|nr:NAD(P)/FAD-dependent oxidoreductase [Saprospiraceae bacterium]